MFHGLDPVEEMLIVDFSGYIVDDKGQDRAALGQEQGRAHEATRGAQDGVEPASCAEDCWRCLFEASPNVRVIDRFLISDACEFWGLRFVWPRGRN